MLVTDSGFSLDFTNHLWLTWAAGRAFIEAGHPSYFINAEGIGVFCPFFAFYGGTLYAGVGVLGQILGEHPTLIFIAVTTLAIAACYGGMLSLSHQLGLRRWLSHLPPLVVVTSAYYISNIYGRSAWPELMATSAIAPMLAGGLLLVRAPAWRPGPVLVFAASAVVFTGSHNITLEWGTIILVVGAAVLWLSFGAPRRLPLRRLIKVGGLGLLSLAVNAWFLIPDLGYARYVYASSHDPVTHEDAIFDTPGVLLDPFRHVPVRSTTPALFVQAPVWFLAWGVLAGGFLVWRRGLDGPLRRAWSAFAALILFILLLIIAVPWQSVPYPLNEVQFPYRLVTYVFYGVGALVLVSALALQRTSANQASRAIGNLLRAALAAVSAISVGLCVWQLWVPETMFALGSYSNRQKALVSPHEPPRSWYDWSSYDDVHSPVVKVAPHRLLQIDPSRVHGDRFSAWVNVPPGLEPIETNIEGGPYLVRISGLARVGHSDKYNVVVRREHNGTGPVHVTVETAHSATLVAAWIISILATLALIAIVAVTATREWRRRARLKASDASA